MLFKDAFRAQYYLSTLQEKLDGLFRIFSKNSNLFLISLGEAFADFITDLASELDQLILPVVANEINSAKVRGLLKGNTPSERYESFFIKEEKYSLEARMLIEKHSSLFSLLDHAISASFQNAEECLHRLIRDRDLLEKEFDIKKHLPLQQVKIISASDRHRGTQALLLIFSDDSRIIYKPTDLNPDLLLHEFVAGLKLPFPYDLKCMKALPCGAEYGWIEFVPHASCSSMEEVRDFYRRAGILLAVADALNYTDGHCENVIAHGAYPVLLDGETLFQNYTFHQTGEEKNVLSTLLLQKIKDTTKIAKYGFHSGFQAATKEKFHALYTYALNDQTDDITVHYRGFLPSNRQNAPTLHGQVFTAQEFIDEVIDGFSFGYDSISRELEKILRAEEWWKRVACVRSRVILRHTIAYLYLIRRIQQPEVVQSDEKIERLMRDHRGETPYTQYEMEDLLKLNIPYFYHIPGELTLFDGHDNHYPNTFPKSATHLLKEQLLDRNEEKRKTEERLIREQLLSSREIELRETNEQ